MKKLLMSLLFGAFVFVGLHGAEQEGKVPSLTALCFFGLFKGLNVRQIEEKIKMQEDNLAQFNSWIWIRSLRGCEWKVVSQEILAIAVQEAGKNGAERRSPLIQFKELYPRLKALIDEKVISYSLSILDLFSAGAQIPFDLHNGLDLSKLAITSLDGLNKCRIDFVNLAHLFLENNEITEIKQESFAFALPNLQSIILLSNKIEKIESRSFVGLPSIKLMIFSSNQIINMEPETFIDLPNLEILSFEENQIEVINKEAFVNLQRLKSLNFSKNKIRAIIQPSFDRLPNLLCLNFYNNQIQKISLEGLVGLQRLQDLILTSNQLKTIDSIVFDVLPSLKNLHFEDNQLLERDIDALRRRLLSVDIYADNQRPLQNENIEEEDDDIEEDDVEEGSSE